MKAAVSTLARRAIIRSMELRRALKADTRAAYHAYEAGMRERANLASVSTEAREEYQLRALRAAARYASSIPFWTNRFQEAGIDVESDFSFVEFQRLPPLERTEIAVAGDALLHPTVPATLRRKMATGGSSGVPTVTWTGPLERGWGESAAHYYEHRIGLQVGDRVALLWGHNLDPLKRDSLRDRSEDWVLNRRWYDCFRLSDDILRDYHQSLNDFRPKVVQAYASALVSLASAIRDLRLPAPRYPTFAFITGAEKVHAVQRSLIEEVFQRPVYERYGGRDIGMIGMQMQPESSLKFSVDWPNVLAEIDGAEDEGDLLVTKLHADAMPLFRYRSGDFVRASNSSGAPLPEIDEVIGRTLERIYRLDGSWMHGTVVPHLLKDFDLRQYQLVQRADYGVELLLVAGEQFAPAHETEVRSALLQNLGDLPLTIRHVERVETTAAGKWIPVISKVKSAKSGAT